MVDFTITDTLHIGEVRNADRIWSSTPQNLAYHGWAFLTIHYK